MLRDSFRAARSSLALQSITHCFGLLGRGQLRDTLAPASTCELIALMDAWNKIKNRGVDGRHTIEAQEGAHLMPREEEVQGQQELLAIYRRQLLTHLKQRAMFGPATPSSILDMIGDARANIQRIKTILRGWNISVEDHPNDAGSP
jgi:hypothetical protein